MTVDFSSLTTNAAMLATILTPLLSYLNNDSQTYFFDLLAVPFAIFLITALTGAIWQGDVPVVLCVIGVVLEIFLYVMMSIEQYYVRKLKVT